MSLCFLFLATIMFSTTAQSFEGLNDNVSLKIFNRINCGDGITCSRVGNGVFNMKIGGAGFVQPQVAATATTITSSQCGSTFINSGAVVMNLPEASSVLGCRLTFITGNASNFDINPDDADIILVETDDAGDSIRNATLGNSIVIEAISATQWAPIATIGTWADNN